LLFVLAQSQRPYHLARGASLALSLKSLAFHRSRRNLSLLTGTHGGHGGVGAGVAFDYHVFKVNADLLLLTQEGLLVLEQVALEGLNIEVGFVVEDEVLNLLEGLVVLSLLLLEFDAELLVQDSALEVFLNEHDEEVGSLSDLIVAVVEALAKEVEDAFLERGNPNGKGS